MADTDLLTPQELADFLDVKLSTIYYWSHIGYIPKLKIGRLLRFRRTTVEAWLKRRERPGRNKQGSDGLSSEFGSV